jgi:hypothetical protein
LLDRLPVTGEILRGSLLKRTIRNHATGCTKCASGEGHPLCSHCELPRRTHAPVQLAPRTGGRGWRRLDGHNHLPKLIVGVKFTDRIEVVRSQAQTAAA